jgi:alpha-1,3/alpha-1,6-mannosyltransferase
LPEVLYPAINLKVFEKSDNFKSLSVNDMLKDQIDEKILKNAKIFTSLNRYERKKNINLAIKAFAKYLSTQEDKN